MKQVTHRVDETIREVRTERLVKLPGDQPQIEARSYGWPGRHGIFRRMSRIAREQPGLIFVHPRTGFHVGVGPLDSGALAHFEFRLLFTACIILWLRLVGSIEAVSFIEMSNSPNASH